jgi:hypothetical protein
VVGVETGEEGVDLVAGGVSLREVHVLAAVVGLSNNTQLVEEATEVSAGDVGVVGIGVDGDSAVRADRVRLNNEAESGHEVGDSLALRSLRDQILRNDVGALLGLDLHAESLEEFLDVCTSLLSHTRGDLSLFLISDVVVDVMGGWEDGRVTIEALVVEKVLLLSEGELRVVERSVGVGDSHTGIVMVTGTGVSMVLRGGWIVDVLRVLCHGLVRVHLGKVDGVLLLHGVVLASVVLSRLLHLLILVGVVVLGGINDLLGISSVGVDGLLINYGDVVLNGAVIVGGGLGMAWRVVRGNKAEVEAMVGGHGVVGYVHVGVVGVRAVRVGSHVRDRVVRGNSIEVSAKSFMLGVELGSSGGSRSSRLGISLGRDGGGGLWLLGRLSLRGWGWLGRGSSLSSLLSIGNKVGVLSLIMVVAVGELSMEIVGLPVSSNVSTLVLSGSLSSRRVVGARKLEGVVSELCRGELSHSGSSNKLGSEHYLIILL